MSRRLLPVLLTAALLVGGCSGDEYVAPPPQQGSEVARPARASDTVAELQDALAAGDAGRARELGADAGAGDLLAALADNVAELRLDDVTLRYVTETGRTAGDDAWDGLVEVTWRHRGLESASARTEVPFSFAEAGSRISGVGAGAERLPLWLTGPLTVRRTAGTVVLGQGPPQGVARYSRLAARAVADVRSVLGGRVPLVVEVPADVEALHDALGAKAGEYDAIAAVTAPVDGSRAPDSPVHVFVNRSVYDALDPVAAQVVMTHEAVHAVTGAALAQRAPLWLVEGFADYIALRDVDLPTARTAGQVIAQVKKGGLPADLPTQVDFDTASTHLGAAYEAAWLVCVTLAERGGQDALVGLYDGVLGGADLAAELRTRFGWSQAELTDAWRGRLADLAGVPQ